MDEVACRFFPAFHFFGKGRRRILYTPDDARNCQDEDAYADGFMQLEKILDFSAIRAMHIPTSPDHPDQHTGDGPMKADRDG